MDVRIVGTDGLRIGEVSVDPTHIYRDIILYLSALWAGETMAADVGRMVRQVSPDVVPALTQVVTHISG